MKKILLVIIIAAVSIVASYLPYIGLIWVAAKLFGY